MAAPFRYRSSDEDSGRWDGFTFREGDIVISTRTKHGTTWTQMICALLIFGTPDLPAPIADLSPWLDWTTRPIDEVRALLDAQTHRRFVKTHTPLDGIPMDPRATYVVVARHPLDAAVSLYHQQLNIDRVRWADLTGNVPPDPDAARPSLHDSLLAWMEMDLDPREHLDLLPGVAWHLTDAWSRRDAPNVVLVHYDDLQADLEGSMRTLADRLGCTVDPSAWPALVDAAGFASMPARAEHTVPDRQGVIRDPRRFFRRGVSGARSDAVGFRGDRPVRAAVRRARPARPARVAPPESRGRDLAPSLDGMFAVDPVPWARAQMALTLGAHIILVPLGVAWAFMILVAERRAIRHGDERRPHAGPPLVEGAGRHVRGRCGHGDGADLRVRAAVAALHGPIRAGLRSAVRDRGAVLLPGGDLPRDLHLRLGPPLSRACTGGAASRSCCRESGAPPR